MILINMIVIIINKASHYYSYDRAAFRMQGEREARWEREERHKQVFITIGHINYHTVGYIGCYENHFFD